MTKKEPQRPPTPEEMEELIQLQTQEYVATNRHGPGDHTFRLSIGEAEFVEKIKTMTGRFQRNNDGQFVGRICIGGKELECWLVFDDKYPVKDEAFLKLSLTTPYTGPVC
jgi:hypothetical protein